MEQRDFLPQSGSHFEQSIGITWWVYFGLGLFLFILQYLARKKKWEDKKKVLIELAFIAGALVPVCLFILVTAGPSFFSSDSIDIPVHNTYFVFSVSTVIIKLWIIAYFVLNLTRQIWLRFQNIQANSFLIAGSCLLILVLSFYIMILNDAGTVVTSEGWTVYPPLSGLPQEAPHDANLAGSILITLWACVAFISAVGILALVMNIRNIKRKA